MQTELLPYLPVWFRQIRDFTALLDAETAEFERLADAMDAVHKNFYLQSADAGTLAQYEGLFGIVPAPGETLSLRRARILNRLSTQPPFTLPYLYGKLDQIIGPGRWNASIDYENCILFIESSAENQAWANEVFVTLNAIKPCHIAYVSKPYTYSGILFQDQVELGEALYKYKLGAWGIGLHPFAHYIDKGVIVTEQQNSVQLGLLSDIAAFAAADIASVRLNGSYFISEFDAKQASDSAVTVQYTVLRGQIPVITKEELLSANGTVLTTAPVYVPVNTSVQFRHTITMKEGR